MVQGDTLSLGLRVPRVSGPPHTEPPSWQPVEHISISFPDQHRHWGSLTAGSSASKALTAAHDVPADGQCNMPLWCSDSEHSWGRHLLNSSLLAATAMAGYAAAQASVTRDPDCLSAARLANIDGGCLQQPL